MSADKQEQTATEKVSEKTQPTEAVVEEAQPAQTVVEEAQPTAALESSPAAQAPLHTIRLNGGELKTSLELDFLKQKHPKFSVGDTLRLHFRIREGDKQRVQVYEGLVIAIRGEGMSRSFIMRRVSHEVGVERIFPYYSPVIQKIHLVRKGRVRRARLYYLRGKSSKEGRIKESFSHLIEKPKVQKANEGQASEQATDREAEGQAPQLPKKKPVKKAVKKISKQSTKKTTRKVTKKTVSTVGKKKTSKNAKKKSKKKTKKKAKKK